MVKTLGQSAMEYMLTYGWAILVVMVVGIVMWQIGIFELGGSIPTTSSGFQQLKPLLATCKMTTEPLAAGFHGFQCMFTNTLQSDIAITDINVSFNEQFCSLSYVTLEPKSPTAYMRRECTTETGTCNDPLCCCTAPPCGYCPPGGPGPYTCINIPAGGTFFVTAMTQWNWPWGPCKDIEPGSKYEAFVKITYDISAFGPTVTKVDSGYIRGAME